jgi:hypothetical protein
MVRSDQRLENDRLAFSITSPRSTMYPTPRSPNWAGSTMATNDLRVPAEVFNAMLNRRETILTSFSAR